MSFRLWRPRVFARFLAGLALLGAAPIVVSAKEEIIPVFQDRLVSINVPEKYGCSATRNELGIVTVRISDPGLKISLQASFFPDPNGKLATEDAQRAFVANASQPYAEGSVEKGYEFKALTPRTGTGIYCVFTDATLVRKLPAPRGEYLQVTSGVKVWAGCFVVITLLSNDTTGDEYQAAMKLLRESFEEKPHPGGPAI